MKKSEVVVLVAIFLLIIVAAFVVLFTGKEKAVDKKDLKIVPMEEAQEEGRPA